MDIEKIYNEEAEMAVLSAVFVKNDSMCEVIEFLKPEDFYNGRHEIIYKNLKKMYEDNIPIDVITLSENMGKDLKKAGGVSYLSNILNSNLTVNNIKKYGEIVKEKSNYRKLHRLFATYMNKLQNDEAEALSIINEVEDALFSIKEGENNESESMEGVMERFIDVLQMRYNNCGGMMGIKSGYKVLDRTLGGLMKQDLIILAARPSMGKSAMAVNLLLNTVFKEGVKAAFFNLEMSEIQVADRIAAIYSGIPMNNVRNADFTDKQWSDISKASAALAASKIKLYDKKITLNAIKAQCKKLKIKEGLDIVFIDYLQLIESEVKVEARNQEISKITRMLKLMAKELDITLIVLSQLSRATEQRADHRPMLSDLRESGSIEQDADMVIFLYRDEYYNADSENKGIIECIVAKNRNGQVGTARLKWQPEFQRICNRK